MPLHFKHVNLELSEAEFKGKKIEIRLNMRRDWEILVNGSVIEGAGTFPTCSKVIAYVNEKLAPFEEKVAPTPSSKVKDSPQSRLKQNGKPGNRIKPRKVDNGSRSNLPGRSKKR